MANLTLDRANRIIEGALAKASEVQTAPLTVAVLDTGGHLVSLQRQDGSALLRPEIAIGKAWGALGLGVPSAAIGQIASERPLLFQALSVMSGGRVVPVPGGVLVRNSSGELVGAVGVTGDTSEKDEACAVHGIQAAGLVPIGTPPG